MANDNKYVSQFSGQEIDRAYDMIKGLNPADKGKLVGVDENGKLKAVDIEDDDVVTGPANSVTNHVVVFEGTTGSVIKDSGYTIGKSVPSDAKFTDTTYQSKTEVQGGTEVSLVTTGEKYTWNHQTPQDTEVLIFTLDDGTVITKEFYTK